MCYIIVMYITEVLTKTKKGKVSHRCILLRESYRENGKVKNRTIANLTHCNAKEVSAMRLALEHKGDLEALKSFDDVELMQGMSVGAVWSVYDAAKRLCIERALGTGHSGKLALWQVIARVIDQGSCLSAVRLAKVHAGCDILGIKRGFSEDNLYKNLAWLSDNQQHIENDLFKNRLKGKKPELFLYDVTSSYLEGCCNELAEWGHNRDKKKGKKQVVVGLLCDAGGDPISVEVFTGSTRDFNTFGSQVDKASREFGCDRVTFVGDRGMIKSGQVKELKEAGFSYITAITKPQIKKLIRSGVFQMELFESEFFELEHEGVRYLLRRNPQRAHETACIREDKKRCIEELCKSNNRYLSEHPRAKVETAFNKIKKRIEALKIGIWLKIDVIGRRLLLKEDKEALLEQSMLDGCYVIKTDLPKDIKGQIVHDRYKDLIKVEDAFRTCKTAMLEMRPWYVWTEKSTRGHALVVMLAYLITHKLQQAWAGLDLTVEEGLKELSMLCSMKMIVKKGGCCHKIPTPGQRSSELLKAADVHLPQTLPHLGTNVVTRKHLQLRRQNH